MAQLREINPLVAGPLLQELAELDALLRGHAGEGVMGRLLVDVRGELGSDLLVAADRLVVGDALIGRTLADQPYGPYLLGAIALGLVCYGAYVLLETVYRKV